MRHSFTHARPPKTYSLSNESLGLRQAFGPAGSTIPTSGLCCIDPWRSKMHFCGTTQSNKTVVAIIVMPQPPMAPPDAPAAPYDQSNRRVTRVGGFIAWG